MGTRHLIKVKHNDKLKVAQYGQWDGYPDGQGVDILSFLSNKIKVQTLKDSLDKIRFLDRKGRDKEFLEEYQKNAPKWSSDPDNRTDEQKFWFETFYSRDVGAKLLENIINFDGDEIVLDKCTDGEEWCEGFYTIDLDKMTFHVRFHEHEETFDINNLPSKEDFLLKFEEDEE